MKNLTVILLLFLSFIVTSTPLLAIDYPRGPVILTLSGMINRSNNAGNAVLDAAALRSLPQVEIITETPWTDGMVSFEGPLLRDVLKLVGAEGESLKVKAINDYSVEIPITDADNFDVILAMRMNKKNMTIRSRGPLWIIYPWSKNDDLQSETYYSRSIWQLLSIDVQ